MEEILKLLIEKIETNPNTPIEESIKAIASELGLNESEMADIHEAMITLDAINEKAADLARKRIDGVTLDKWIQEQLGNIETKAGAKSEEVIAGLEEGVKTSLNNTLTQKI